MSRGKRLKTKHIGIISAAILAVLILSSSREETFVLQSFPAEHFQQNAIWIYNQAWVDVQKDVLANNLTGIVKSLRDRNITMAFVFVGYFNPATNRVDQYPSDSLVQQVIAAFHSIGLRVLAWGENGYDPMDIRPANRENIYNEIRYWLDKGFDGWHDDIERYLGTHQEWIYYLNNATTVCHERGKLMTAAIPYDWEQNTNPYLRMDYIVTMFYSSRSTCEDPQGVSYFQENFGQYHGNNSPPASPLILGIMNYKKNSHSLGWQLSWIQQTMASNAHPNLVGFSIWIYEYMSPKDWQTWDSIRLIK